MYILVFNILKFISVPILGKSENNFLKNNDFFYSIESLKKNPKAFISENFPL